MLKQLILVGGLSVLAGCGDPLAALDRIGDVDLAQEDGTAAALPTAEETTREGFFGTKAAEPTAPATAAAQEATGAPLDPTIYAEKPVAPVEEPPKRGVLGLLRRAFPGEDAPETEAAAAAPEAAVTAVEGATDTDTQSDAVAQAVAAAQSQTPDPAADPAASTAPVETAALAPEPALTPGPAEKPARRGLFGRNLQKKDQARTGPDAREADYGEVLPYGVIARVCAARGRPLGRKIEKADARGYALYDSTPTAGGVRTWYLTGFGDGCPRQFTAANAQIASASLYEQLHYGPAGKHRPRGATDAAYEGIKRKVCRSGKGKPCGAQIGKMDKSTFFVTAYERFGNSSRWSEILVHDGGVVALAIKP